MYLPYWPLAVSLPCLFVPSTCLLQIKGHLIHSNFNIHFIKSFSPPFIGGLLCLLSSLPHLDKLLGYETQYWFALIGQCMYGLTYTIVQNLTTELSESWFDAGQRVLGTATLNNYIGHFPVVWEAETQYKNMYADVSICLPSHCEFTK